MGSSAAQPLHQRPAQRPVRQSGEPRGLIQGHATIADQDLQQPPRRTGEFAAEPDQGVEIPSPDVLCQEGALPNAVGPLDPGIVLLRPPRLVVNDRVGHVPDAISSLERAEAIVIVGGGAVRATDAEPNVEWPKAIEYRTCERHV